ncbi:MAG TPA: 4'-phosphopantetheinyl transferase superfamily protein [Candidatus Binataceae bacterium]|nr:4'-phosphopantetheinyl transferase superfamily protein [Candidatus Binataceae bacterium]
MKFEVRQAGTHRQIRRTPELGEDEIHIWTVRLDVDEETLGELEVTLAADELERARRFHFARDRRRFMAGRGTMRELIGGYVQNAPSALEFSYNEFGKPSLAGAGEALRFNLAHSGELAILAITRGREVGVDVEELVPARADRDVARNFFSADEVQRLEAMPQSLWAQAFFQCWTRKEAYIKARGKGLSIPLDSFDVSIGSDEPVAILREAESAEAGQWRLCDLDLDHGHVGALAAHGWDWKSRLYRCR